MTKQYESLVAEVRGMIENFKETHDIVITDKTSDQDIEGIISSEMDVSTAMEVLLIMIKREASVRKLAEKREKELKTILSVTMKSTGTDTLNTDDGTATIKPKASFTVVDYEQLDEKYKQHSYSWSTINKAILGGEKIQGIDVGIIGGSLTVR